MRAGAENDLIEPVLSIHEDRRDAIDEVPAEICATREDSVAAMEFQCESAFAILPATWESLAAMLPIPRETFRQRFDLKG